MSQKIMKIEVPVKFNIGDKAWHREKPIYNSREIPCPACNGLGKIKLKGKRAYECPACRGKKEIRAGEKVVGFIALEVEVVGIFVDKMQVGEDTSNLRKNMSCDSISCDYRYIGQVTKGGYCHENNLYDTREEAETLK